LRNLLHFFLPPLRKMASLFRDVQNLRWRKYAEGGRVGRRSEALGAIAFAAQRKLRSPH
jgi:hypothetical protein